MALTVDNAVSEVVGRLRPMLAFVGLSVLTTSSNPDVTPAVRDALWYFELTPSDYPAVSDADLATLADPMWFLDGATLRALYRIQAAFTDVDETVEKNSQKLSQYADRIAAMVSNLEARVPRMNVARGGIGSMANPALVPGYTLDSAGVFHPWGPYPCGG